VESGFTKIIQDVLIVEEKSISIQEDPIGLLQDFNFWSGNEGEFSQAMT